MIRSGVAIRNVQKWQLLRSPDNYWYAVGQFSETNHAGMLIMQRDLLNVNADCIVRPEAVGCEDDAPTSFVVAHSRGIYDPSESGLCYMKLLR